VLDNRKEPLPSFLPAQTTFTENDQSRMSRSVEKFNEISRVRGDHRKVDERLRDPHAGLQPRGSVEDVAVSLCTLLPSIRLEYLMKPVRGGNTLMLSFSASEKVERYEHAN
jgi:hypothetical protein